MWTAVSQNKTEDVMIQEKLGQKETLQFTQPFLSNYNNCYKNRNMSVYTSFFKSSVFIDFKRMRFCGVVLKHNKT